MHAEVRQIKSCSHGAIVTVIYLLQLMGCMGFSVILGITPCGYLH